MPDGSLPVIDMHTHLAGLGHGGTGCFIAPRKFRSLLFSLLRWRLGLRGAERRGRQECLPYSIVAQTFLFAGAGGWLRGSTFTCRATTRGTADRQECLSYLPAAALGRNQSSLFRTPSFEL